MRDICTPKFLQELFGRKTSLITIAITMTFSFLVMDCSGVFLAKSELAIMANHHFLPLICRYQRRSDF